MSELGVKLAGLRTSLTLAENRRKNAEISVKMASNKFVLEDAQRELADSTKEVTRLQREIAALEKPQ